MNVKNIVLAKIEAVGADGLCNSECGCGKDDLFAECDEYSDCSDCVLAKAVLKRDYCKTQDCDECNEAENCDGFLEASITDAKRYVPMEEQQ